MGGTDELVRNLIADVVDIDPVLIRPTSSLDDLGLDSFGRAEVFLSISEALGIEIPIELLAAIVTVADLCAWTEKWAT